MTAANKSPLCSALEGLYSAVWRAQPRSVRVRDVVGSPGRDWRKSRRKLRGKWEMLAILLVLSLGVGLALNKACLVFWY
jgi:hypothetical protein